VQITAATTRPGDIVRGIGLVVEFSEPQDDNTTHLAGYVIPERAVPDARYAVELNLPNEHRINVRRQFAVGDIVTVPVYVWDDGSEDFMDEQYVRSEVMYVYGDEKLLTIRREGDPTDTSVVSVPFFRARHAGAVEAAAIDLT
jgi:hypothetical protein